MIGQFVARFVGGLRTWQLLSRCFAFPLFLLRLVLRAVRGL